MNWRKLLICCVSFATAFFANVAIDLACGGEIDPYDYYISFYHNNLQGGKAYGSFYFTNYQYLFDDTEPVSEADINATEWAAYLGTSVKNADVKKAMYGLDSASNVAVNQQLLAGKNSVADSLARNTFLAALSAKNYQNARNYYLFAKEVEPIANSKYNVWDPAPMDTIGLQTAAEKALHSAASEKDDFLKLRYAYQAERLFHYSGNYQKARNVYNESIFKNTSKSHIKGWALALKAGEDRKLGDTLQAAFQFAQVFAAYPERRLQAYRNYHYINAKTDQVITLTKNDADKAIIYAINGFADPEISMDYLEKVYQYQPASPMVGVLLVREVNKLEQYYLTDRLNNLTDSAAKSPQQFKLVSSEKSDSTENKNRFGWILFSGSVLLIIGMTGLVLKKKPVKEAWKIGFGLLLISGGALMVYAFFTDKKMATETENIQANPQFFTQVSDSIQTKYNDHIQKLVGFCDQLSAEKKYPESSIGNLTKAYLWWMQGKTADGFTAIAASEKDELNAKLKDQQQIVKLLLSAQKIQQVDSVNESALLPALKWLDGKVKVTPTETVNKSEWLETRVNRFATTSRDFYLHILAPAYLHQGDTTKAALAILKSESYGDYLTDYPYMKEKPMPDFWYNFLQSKQLEQFAGWKTNPPKTPWLQFLTAGSQNINSSDLYDLLGTAYLREHNYTAAVTAFAHQKKKDKRSIDDEEGNPFLDQLNDYPKTFSAPRQGFTKTDFAKAMAALENKIKAEPQNPQNLYQLATALYNTSTYGNSWNIISYNWSSMDFARKSIYTYDTDYVQTSNAEKYYLQARQLSNDANFKAKCTFMAAKCQQKQQRMPSYMSNYDTYVNAQKNYYKQLRRNPYFKELEQYQQTSFYKTAVAECSYLRDFIAGK